VKASLFITCVVDQFYPQVGFSTVRLLRRLGVEVDFPNDQTCCGQPAFNSGFCSEARPLAERFLSVFEDSEYVVAPSGSCVSMVKEFFPDLLKDDDRLRVSAERLAKRTYELSEFIVKVLGIKDVGAIFNGRVALHQSCHLLRELGVRNEPRMLLENVRGIELVELQRSDACCGFGGLFSVKYPHISGGILEEKMETIKQASPEFVVASDMGCLMHIGGGLSRAGMRVRTLHLAEILASTEP
jgi:L-lactate dehydrogenase complex protein LldE